MTATSAPNLLEPPSSRPPTLVLTGPSSSPVLFFKELWRSRELVVLLARREFHTRYRRASFGVLWALILPLVQSLVMAAFLGRFIRIQSGVNYPAFILTGIVAWTFFSAAMGTASTAIVDAVSLASRVYFPRAVLPIVQVLQNLYAFSITIVVVLAILPAFGVHLGAQLVLIVPATLLLILLALGFSLIFSALHVFFRDVRYIITAALTVWIYAAPIIYSASAPQVRRFHTLINLDPITGAVDLFRAATVGGGPLLVPVTATVVWTAGLLLTGFALQCRFNRAFTDLM